MGVVLIAVSNRDPRFLAEVLPRAYITLIDSEQRVRGGAKYLTFDAARKGREWKVWRMHRTRVPIPLGAFSSLISAEYALRKPERLFARWLMR